MPKSPRDLYLKKRFFRNRNAVARAVDVVFFLAVVFFAALLFFRGRIQNMAVRLLLAGIAASAAGILLRIVTGLRYEAFCKKETARILETLFFDRLCFLGDAKLKSLIKPNRPGSSVRILHRAEPADADAVLSALGSGKPALLLATAGFTDSAKAFAERQGDAIRLIDPKTLLPEAKKTKLFPDVSEADAEMERRYLAQKQARGRAVRLAFSGAFPGKYYLCAASLIALSFLTRYALYYRLLAVFTMCAAVLGSFFSRSERMHPGA